MTESNPHRAKVEIGVVLMMFFFCFPALVMAQSRPVRTASGLVSGVALTNGLEVFKGIPFAAPPVGKLRWRPPEPLAAWQGVRKAGNFGPPCMQPASPVRAGVRVQQSRRFDIQQLA